MIEARTTADCLSHISAHIVNLKHMYVENLVKNSHITPRGGGI